MAKKTGAPRRGRDGRYSLPDGSKHISVTNIKKDGVPLDLTGWAGWEAGLLAVESVPKLIRLRGLEERRKAAYWLGQAAERKKREAGALGSAVHDAFEAYILGEPTGELSPEVRPFFDAFLRFMEIEQPEFEATELVLANPDDGWAGTADAFGTLPRRAAGLHLLDWKSGSGTYADFAMQLAAYRRATVGWTKDGTEITPPTTEQAFVVHVRPDKYPDVGYRIYPLDTSEAVYEAFLAARRVALEWTRGLSKTVLGKPLEPLAVEVLDAEIVEEEVA